MDYQGLGKKIQNYRKNNQMTIKDFSERTGLSCALISQLERDIGNPTLLALQAIAEALGITVSRLLENEISNKDLILRKKDMDKVVYSGNEHIVYNVVAPGPVKSKLEVLLMSLSPNGVTHGGFVRHDSEEEIAYVLSGEATVSFEGEDFILEKGDSVRIMPGRKHKFKNEGTCETKVLFARIRS